MKTLHLIISLTFIIACNPEPKGGHPEIQASPVKQNKSSSLKQYAPLKISVKKSSVYYEWTNTLKKLEAELNEDYGVKFKTSYSLTSPHKSSNR
jgi:hypothetical protein